MGLFLLLSSLSAAGYLFDSSCMISQVVLSSLQSAFVSPSSFPILVDLFDIGFPCIALHRTVYRKEKSFDIFCLLAVFPSSSWLRWATFSGLFGYYPTSCYMFVVISISRFSELSFVCLFASFLFFCSVIISKTRYKEADLAIIQPQKVPPTCSYL